MNSQDDYIDFENSIGPWLGKTVKLLDYHLIELFSEQGLDLSKEQMITLKKLHKKDGLNQNELAFLTFRDKSSLARLLSKMENKGYLERRQSKEDKRVNQVFLTDVGRNIFKKTTPILKKFINVMEQNISEEERLQVIKTLKKVQRNFGESLHAKTL